MKKTFQLVHPKIKPARLIEAVRRDVKKYIKREKRKLLPEGVDYWDFDCKYGLDEASAEVVHVSAFNKLIDAAEAAEAESFYVEILVKPSIRTFVERDEPEESEDYDESE